MTEPAASPTPRARTEWGDLIFRALSAAAGLFIIGVAVALVAVLVYQSWPTLRHLFTYQFLTSSEWKANADPPKFGALAFVFGTLTTSAIALLIAVPLGVGAAAFLSEIAPAWIRRGGSFLIELLAAVPSVVYGFWGLDFLRPGVQWMFNRLGGPNTGGAGILSAGVILAIMIVPYITAISFDVCRAVPRSQREGALALGATRWQMIRTVVLPYARPGILAACFLALGRALGETMAVTMMIGNNPVIEFSLFAKGDSIASVIANRLNEAETDQIRSALVTLGLLLLVITAVLNILARWLIVGPRGGKTEFSAPPTDGAASELPAAALELPPPVEVKPAPGRQRYNTRVNTVMTGVLGLSLAACLIPLFLILGYITYRGVSGLNLALFTDLPRQVDGVAVGGLRHAMVGSAILVALASAMAVPIGIMAAVFLAESRSVRLAGAVRFVTELLGGVPSIVLGIFGYAVLVRPVWAGTVDRNSFSAWAGSMVLAIMMLPVVVRSAEEALRLVPQSLRHGSYALGAAYWQTVLRVTLPAALPAVITGVILAAARIAGETAPLLLTAGGSQFMPRGLGDPTPFLPGYIFSYSKSPEPELQQQAWAAAFVLVTVIVLLNVTIRYVTGKRVIAASQGG